MADQSLPDGSTEMLGEQLRRERVVDMELRLAPYRRIAFAALAVALLTAGPWMGWWWMIPLAAAAIAFAVVDRYLIDSARPEIWVAAGWAVSPLMIALSVALTGASESPAIGWFALPAMTLGSRFEGRGTIIGGVYVAVLLLASTIGTEQSVVLDDPSNLVFAIALVVAAVALAGAVGDSDREHRRSAVLDPLTGLFNRAALAQRVEELSTGAEERPGERIGVLIGDLDKFKQINDTHGHAKGDAVLTDVAYALARSVRSFDTVYRIGGEEFLVLLPDANAEGVERIGERLGESVRACLPAGIPVTMSFGGNSTASERLDFSALTAAADGALYAAKRGGRDRVVMAGSETAARDRREAGHRAGDAVEDAPAAGSAREEEGDAEVPAGEAAEGAPVPVATAVS